MRLGRRQFVATVLLGRTAMSAGGLSKPAGSTTDGSGSVADVSVERLRERLRIVYGGSEARSLTVTVDGTPTSAQFEAPVERGDALDFDARELRGRTLRVVADAEERRTVLAERRVD
ncbi:hypothetical protein BRC94_00770 [Halobacteriales archaeon QS_5_70_17]|jgi:hypothetical protein|nr:MAG: hypothetical protein BRC94_00770 [Halobacteriales archaeon QS_5_70_17]